MIAKLPAVLVVCFLASILQQRVFAQNVLNTVYGDPNDYLGFSVSGAGDVDNDGFADSLVGAPEDDTNGALCGMIRVYSGRTGAVLYSRYGDAAGDMLGDSVSDVGDVNGDGFDDFIAGAGSATWNGQQVGMIRVYSGRDGGILYSRYGAVANDFYGHSVSGAGDVNNDGFDDFIGGAHGSDFNGGNSGALRVYSGRSGTPLYTLFGDSGGSGLGYSVSGAGDVDNDGFDDFCTGAPFTGVGGTWAGMLRVYSGQSGAVLYSRYGSQPYDTLGHAVSHGGDVDGDGGPDLIVGAPWEDSHGHDAGMVRVYSGLTGAVLSSCYGDHAGQELGRSVSGAGDLNGDGLADFVVGTPYENLGGGLAGMMRVYSGQTGAVLHEAYGTAASEQLGHSVSGAGDVNADGILDVIAGAPGNHDTGWGTGMARVYTGPCAAVESYGVGCLGPNDTHIPVLSIETDCFGVGGQATLKIENAWGGGTTFMLLSTQRASDYWKYDCSFLVQSPFSVLYFGALHDDGPPPNGNGWLDLSLPIPHPMSPAILTLQAGIVQPGTGAKNLTNGMEINVP